MRDRRPGEPESEVRLEHDLPGQEPEPYIPGLYRAALEQLKGPPIYLDLAQAELVLAQFQETAANRGWLLRAAAIMCNHFHLVVRAPDEVDPGKMLADFKAYASRVLNRRYGFLLPKNGGPRGARKGSSKPTIISSRRLSTCWRSKNRPSFYSIAKAIAKASPKRKRGESSRR